MKNINFILIMAFVTILKVQSIHEFKVGGDKGWAIPSSNDTDHYNIWASDNRFSINDTLRFEYKKDSVLVVTREEHEKCISPNPMSFFDNGDTYFKLERSGYFYFISGVSEHCERGLKMIIKVLEPKNNDAAAAADQTSANTTSDATTILKMDTDTLSQTLMIVGIIAMFTVFYM